MWTVKEGPMWRKRTSAVAWAVLGAAVYGVIGNQSNQIVKAVTGGGLPEILWRMSVHVDAAKYDDIWTDSEIRSTSIRASLGGYVDIGDLSGGYRPIGNL
jgi:hypothetical protein